jgi:hypothetical protein
MYPSILSFKTINKLKLSFECGIPRPQDVGHLLLRYCNFFNPFYNLNCSAWERAPGLQKRATFSTLNVGLAGTRNRTRATCVASSGTNRSAIHYASHRFCRHNLLSISVNRSHNLKKWNATCEIVIPSVFETNDELGPALIWTGEREKEILEVGRAGRENHLKSKWILSLLPSNWVIS